MEFPRFRRAEVPGCGFSDGFSAGRSHDRLRLHGDIQGDHRRIVTGFSLGCDLHVEEEFFRRLERLGRRGFLRLGQMMLFGRFELGLSDRERAVELPVIQDQRRFFELKLRYGMMLRLRLLLSGRGFGLLLLLSGLFFLGLQLGLSRFLRFRFLFFGGDRRFFLRLCRFLRLCGGFVLGRLVFFCGLFRFGRGLSRFRLGLGIRLLFRFLFLWFDLLEEIVVVFVELVFRLFRALLNERPDVLGVSSLCPGWFADVGTVRRDGATCYQ